MEETNPQVVQQPQPATSNVIIPPHSNKMTMSIVVTIFCCLIGGIIAIINSSKSNELYNNAVLTSDEDLKQKLFLQSEQKNKTAQTWITVSLVVGIVWVLLYIILFATGVLAEYYDF